MGAENSLEAALKRLALPYYMLSLPLYSIQLATSLVPLVGSAGFAQFVSQDFLTTAIAFVGGAIASAAVYILLSNYHYGRLIDNSHNPLLEFIGEELKYSVFHDKKILHKTICVRARFNGPQEYYFSYSGVGLPAPVIVSTLGCEAELFHPRHSADERVKITFPSPLSSGEAHRFSFELAFADPDQAIRPYYAYTITQPVINGIGIRIVFCLGDRQISYQKRVFKTRVATVSSDRQNEDGPVEGNTVDWKIRNPKYMHRYRISWEA